MRIIQVLLFFVLLVVSQSAAFAHSPGQPSFFEINGQYTGFYVRPSNVAPSNDLPQDIPAQSYFLTNQKLTFLIDLTKLPQAPGDLVARTKFSWNFGDGTTTTGLQSIHEYGKPGSYILKVFADDGTTPAPQLFESVLITIKQPASSRKTTSPVNTLFYVALALSVALVFFFAMRKILLIRNH